MGKMSVRMLSLSLVIALVGNVFLGVGKPAVVQAASQEYTVMASKDGFVRRTDPAKPSPDYSNLPYGGESAKGNYLNIKATGTTPREAYVQFDLDRYPETITSAVLYLYGRNDETAPNTVTTQVYGLDSPAADSWEENTLTWNNKPGPGGNLLGTMTFPAMNSGATNKGAQWISLDVTSFVQSRLAGDKLASFALAGGGNMIRVESRITTTNDVPGHRAAPYLVINGTPALKSVAVGADKTSMGLGQTAALTVSGLLDTGEAADLSGATVVYSSDSPSIVIDNPSLGLVRAAADGTAAVTAAVTLEGVTRSASIVLTADGTPPAEVSQLAGGLVNGDYTLTWTDPADPDFSGVLIYRGSELAGTAAKGVGAYPVRGLNDGETYTFTVKTMDEAGNTSSGASHTFVYVEPNVLAQVAVTASRDTVKPGESLSFAVRGVMKDGSAADLAQASVVYLSSSGSLVFSGSGAAVAEAVYAGAAQVKAAVTLNGVTRESAPVLVRVYPVAQDEYDVLRIKYVQKFTGYNPDEPYNLADPDIQYIIRTQDADVKNHWDALNKTAYTWPDLTSTTKSVELSTASTRLRAMSRAWATYGSAHYQDEALLHDILAAWNQFNLLRYNETKSQYDNWFDWLVTVPNNINDSMAALYEELPHSDYPDLAIMLNRAIDKFVPSISRTGANRVYISKVLMLRGITGKNGAKIQEGSNGLSEVFRNVTSGDGFYDDGSFIQHDYFPYAGGYGKALLQDLSETLWLVSGSAWDNRDPFKGNLFEWYFQAFEPNLYKGQLINAVNGREIARDYTFGGFAVMNALLLQSEMESNPYREQMKSVIKYHIENASASAYLSTATIWNLQKARKLLEETAVEAYQPPEGNFLFYNQDNVVQRNGDWLYSIPMHSDRMANYETVNNENLKGWYQADGMTQLYTDPLDYLSLFWITVDPHRLPGITVDRDVNRPVANTANRPFKDISKYQGDGELMANSWTGGVSLDGQYGTAGMDFKQHHYADMDVSAKKSWFMFDDEIVALGAGINSTSGRPIETIVENRTLNAQGDNALTVDGAADLTPAGQEKELEGTGWIHLDGTGGYVFPGGADVRMLREERAGKSNDINERFIISGNDEFNSATRSSYWGWIREDASHTGLADGKLRITSQTGKLRGADNSTLNLLQTAAPKEDFYITTSVDFAPVQQGQEAGLLIRKDDDNYVSLASGVTAQGPGVIAVSETEGTAQVLEFPLPAAESGYLKIDKSGDHYAVYAGAAEGSWGEPLAVFTNPMAGTDRINTGLRMGLFAQNGSAAAAPELAAAFDFFHLWHTRNYMTLWMEHGVQPENAQYSYIQLPKKNASEVAAYSSSPDVTILSNTPEVQAAVDAKLGITGMNFWKSGVLGQVKASHSSSLMMKENGDELRLAVSDPTHKQDTVRFEIKKTGTDIISKDDTVKVLQLAPTIIIEVDTTVKPGQTHSAAFRFDPSVEAAEFAAPQLKTAEYASASVTVPQGESATAVLKAWMDDASAVDMDAATVVYYSSNETVAAVNSAGVIAGAAPGTAMIYADVTLNGVTRTAGIRVLVPSDTPSAVKLKPVKDTFVRSGLYQSDSYGSDTKLNVKNAGGDDYREAYFGFDLSGATGDIESVKLYVTGKLDDTGGTFVDTVIRPVLESWEEGSINYISKPKLGRPVSEAGRFTNTEIPVGFDITDYAREQLRNGTALNLALVQDVLVGRKMYVYSRESQPQQQPYLEVVTHPVSGEIHDSGIQPSTANFDKNIAAEGYRDIPVTVAFNGNRLERILQGTAILVQGTDYTVQADRIILKKEYLAGLPAGTATLTFEFSAGAAAALTVELADSKTHPGEEGGEQGNGGDGGDEGSEEGGVNGGDSQVIPGGNEPATGSEKGEGVIVLKAAAASAALADGTGIAKLQINAEALNQVLARLKDYAAGSKPVIVIQSEGDVLPDSGWRVELPAEWVSNAAGLGAQASLSIRHGKYGMELPLQVLSLNSKETKLVVTALPVTKQEKPALYRTAAEEGLELLGMPVDFAVSLEGDGGVSRIIPDFGYGYAVKTFILDGPVNPAQTTVLQLQPGTNGLRFVPATFAGKDGQTVATVHGNSNGIYAVAAGSRSFSDLDGHWARKDIELLASKRVVNGVDGSGFQPERSITRAEFVALLVRGLGLAEEADASGFADVKEADWFAGAAAAALQAGLIEGVEEGLFQPDATLSREQMAVLMIRAAKLAGSQTTEQAGASRQFADHESISGWAAASVEEAVARGFMTGMTADTFEPAAAATRAQATVILKRMLQSMNFID